MPRIIHSVFVILPLQDDDHVDRVFTNGIEPALNHFGFEARRVDNQVLRAGIVDAIRAEIERAYFLVADLSFERPNCYYELGFAQAIRKPVLLIKDKRTPVHFDIAHQMVHSFDERKDIKEMISNLVPKFLMTVNRPIEEDTQNGRFGRQCIRDEFRLIAEITDCSKRECWLDFEVCSLNPDRPLTGNVTFYLHDSYAKTVQSMRAVNGIAKKVEVNSTGPWTLGAVVEETQTRLELDLATIPGAKCWWYT